MTTLDIANAALLRIGQRSIQSLDENSADARLVNELLDDTILEVLRELKPHSARKRALLVRLPDTPIFGYDYAYEVPADYVGGMQCYNSYGYEDDYLFWEIEGNSLLTDASTIYCSYVHIPTDIGVLDVLTSRVISLKLAIEMAYSKTENNALVEGLINEYERLRLQKARSLDSIESRKEKNFGEQYWVESRNNNF